MISSAQETDSSAAAMLRASLYVMTVTVSFTREVYRNRADSGLGSSRLLTSNSQPPLTLGVGSWKLGVANQRPPPPAGAIWMASNVTIDRL